MEGGGLGETGTGRRQWERLLFVGVLLLYIALRLAQSLGAASSFDDEDGWTLAAAWELLNGPAWPYQAYQLSDWECGTRLVAWLAVPFTWLLGPSLLALKLTGLVISTLTLAGIWLLTSRCYGLTAALLAALLYALFPAPVFTYSVTAHGFHPDSMAFQVLFLWLAAGLYAGPRTPRRALLAGAVGGFAVFFAYISAIGVLAGAIPLLWMMARRGGAARRARGWLLAGFAAGGAPLLLYNLLNGFAGLRTYHGSLASYVTPTASADRLERFQQFTLEAARGFSRLYAGEPEREGQFELAFWVVAAGALLMPLLVRGGARLLGSQSPAGAPSAARFCDLAGLLMTGLTIAVFFISGHPVGVMHMVPLLVALIIVIAGRLGRLATRGRLAGKVLAGGLVACFVWVCLPPQLEQIRPGKMDLAGRMEARHYQLWLYRAQRVYERKKDNPRLDAVRHLSMVVPFELAKNDEHRVHLVTSTILADKDVGAALVRFLTAPPQLTVRYDPYETAGLVLVNLLKREGTDAARLLTLLERLPGRGVPRTVETLAFHMRRGGHKFEPLLRALAVKAAASATLGPPALAAMARGTGRARAIALVTPGNEEICGDPLLPAGTREAFTEGLARGLVQWMIKPVPRWADEKLCEGQKAGFWKAVEAAGPPSEVVLVEAAGL